MRISTRKLQLLKLNEMLCTYFGLNGTNYLIDIISTVVDENNRSKHTTTIFCPVNVTNGIKNEAYNHI